MYFVTIPAHLILFLINIIIRVMSIEPRVEDEELIKCLFKFQNFLVHHQQRSRPFNYALFNFHIYRSHRGDVYIVNFFIMALFLFFFIQVEE